MKVLSDGGNPLLKVGQILLQLRYGGLFAEEHKEQPAGLYYRDENGRLKKVILP